MTGFYTIATRAFVPQVSVWADAINKHHPTVQVHVIWVERGSSIPELNGVTNHGVSDLALNMAEITARYNIAEVCYLLKPIVGAYLIEHAPSINTWWYSDTDMYFVHTLPMTLFPEEASFALTPHLLNPADDGCYPSTFDTLRTGLYNMGMFAFHANSTAMAILRWWGERTLEQGEEQTDMGWSSDQSWAQAIPHFFSDVHIINHPGVNVAFWNIHERSLHMVNKAIMAGDKPLICVHFSKFNCANSDALVTDAWCNRAAVKGPAILEIVKNYSSALCTLTGESSKSSFDRPPSKRGAIYRGTSHVARTSVFILNTLPKSLRTTLRRIARFLLRNAKVN